MTDSRPTAGADQATTSAPPSPEDQKVDFFAERYPPADITATEFEQFVAALFASAAPYVEDLRVALHEIVEGVDGSYDFDATIRFRLAGMELLVVVEAKRHTNPVKRELVQALHSKCLSVGAHKGVLITTSRFQRGAIEFARVHRIALVGVTEGRFTYETRTAGAPLPLSREDAAEQFGLPTFVGHCYTAGDSPSATLVTLMSTEYPEHVAQRLLGTPANSSDCPG